MKAIKENQSHWTESMWYGIIMYLIGIGSGALIILTFKALGIIT